MDAKIQTSTPQQSAIFNGHTNIDLAGLGEPCDSLLLISSKVLGPDSEDRLLFLITSPLLFSALPEKSGHSGRQTPSIMLKVSRSVSPVSPSLIYMLCLSNKDTAQPNLGLSLT